MNPAEEGHKIFFTESRYNTYIYRILKKEYFLDLISNNLNTLVKPKKWKDPMENLILQNGYVTKSGAQGDFTFKNDFYAQCWSLEKRSDAMWQVNTPFCGKCNEHDHSVRLRTTIGNLISSLRSHEQIRNEQCRIGKIIYLKDSEINNFIRQKFNNGASTNSFFSTLMIKRKPFSWEKEVRIIYFDPLKRNNNGDIFRYNFNVNENIDQVMADPFMNPIEFKKLKDQIQTELGFKGSVLQSKMYHPPKGLFIEMPEN